MPRQFRITVNGTDYQVAVEELATHATPAPLAVSAAAPPPVVHAPAAAPARAAAAPAPVTGADVVAQMGGVIAQIFAKPGQTVNEGFRLMELEAMKMKIPVLATRDGQVSIIHVSEGEAVEIGQALVSFA